MKLSTRARYALQCMIAIEHLAEGQRPVTMDSVARKTGISKRYLEQLALALKNASLLHSVSGRGGGYSLTREADDIRIGEIIETAIGPINVVDCVLHPETCEKADGCRCRSLYKMINDGITNAIYEFSLADMCDINWHERIGQMMFGETVEADCSERQPPAPANG